MRIDYSKKFIKQYHKLQPKTQKRFKERLELFQNDPNDPVLHNHALKGKYQGFYSIDVSGDIRALYTKSGSRIIIFGFIGTHSQIYG